MTPDEIRAAFAEARAESLETLARIADIRVERRSHDDDGFLSPWSRGMPPKPKPPTIEQVREEIASAINQHKGLMSEVVAQALASERARHRAEVEKLRSEHDLRISALMQAVKKLERGLGGQRNRQSDHSDFMDICVPDELAKGRPQDQAVAACLNMWREKWERDHPDGSDDPGPDRPQKATSVIDLPCILPRKQRHG